VSGFGDDPVLVVEDSVRSGEGAEGSCEDVLPVLSAAGIGGEDGGGQVIGWPAAGGGGHRYSWLTAS
jgi:hypothetical protein